MDEIKKRIGELDGEIKRLKDDLIEKEKQGRHARFNFNIRIAETEIKGIKFGVKEERKRILKVVDIFKMRTDSNVWEELKKYIKGD